MPRAFFYGGGGRRKDGTRHFPGGEMPQPPYIKKDEAL